MKPKTHLCYLSFIFALIVLTGLFYRNLNLQIKNLEAQIEQQEINLLATHVTHGFSNSKASKHQSPSQKDTQLTAQIQEGEPSSQRGYKMEAQTGNDTLTDRSNQNQETPSSSQPASFAEIIQQQVEDLATRFENEDYHYESTYLFEQQITDMFALKAQELEKLNIQRIDCKTSICQLNLQIEGDQYAQMMQLQRALLEQDWYGTENKIVFNKQEEQFEEGKLFYEVYISFRP